MLLVVFVVSRQQRSSLSIRVGRVCSKGAMSACWNRLRTRFCLPYTPGTFLYCRSCLFFISDCRCQVTYLEDCDVYPAVNNRLILKTPTVSSLGSLQYVMFMRT